MTLYRHLCRLASACLLVCGSTSYAAVTLGADTSWLTEQEANGYQFYNSSGVRQDLLPILKQHGMSAVRLRVWVNPQGGYNGMTDVLAKAQRVKAAGMKLMIDFHYSDSWADPGQQTKPAAWSNYNLQQLMDSVWNHTRNSLLQLKSAGITPDWVQVGNETNDGMLWPEGRASLNMQGYAWLTNTGYNAVKDVFPATPVVVHLANCHNVENFRWIFNGLKANGGKFDIIAASAYPTNATGYTWQNANAACLFTLNEMVSTYGTPVMITEVGAPWDHAQAKQIVADYDQQSSRCSSRQRLSGVLLGTSGVCQLAQLFVRRLYPKWRARTCHGSLSGSQQFKAPIAKQRQMYGCTFNEYEFGSPAAAIELWRQHQSAMESGGGREWLYALESDA